MGSVCLGCGLENREGAKRCRDCGAALPQACGQCQAINKPEARFCVQCGEVLSAGAAEPAAEVVPVAAHAQGPEPVTMPQPPAPVTAPIEVPPAEALPEAQPAHASAAPPAPHTTLDFQFDEPAGAPSSSSARWVVAIVAALAMAAGGWWFWGSARGDRPLTSPAVPSVAVPSAPPSVPASAPEEVFLDPEPPVQGEAAAVAHVPGPAAVSSPTAPASADGGLGYTPVTVPRVPDAVPMAPERPRSPPRAPVAEQPWPPVERPRAAATDLGALRDALARCSAMGNDISTANCTAWARRNHCGDAWGRVPECPVGNR